ncbi:MAG: Glutamyl-tRNA reductase [Opitutia bacterium UBA7350]|nr:MAG: Glutamyl-tRNA reductase [Opitutae bacterium UBA7350]
MSEMALQALFVLGCSHHETPLEVRERLALTPERIPALLQELKKCPDFSESLALATCNRLEIYAYAKNDNASQSIQKILCNSLGIKNDFLETHAYQLQNLNAIQHAFSLAAGLDSQILGETEILGQMKQALATAQASKNTGALLNRLFEKSFQAAKIARTQTGIDKGHVSIGNIAADLAKRIFGKLETSRVLLIGSGDVGQRTAKALKNRGVRDLTVTNRTSQNAQELAGQLHAGDLPFNQISSTLHEFDIIISSTAAPNLILKQEDLLAANRLRPAQPFFLIDLALPRDFDPNLEQVENCYLYNLDDLATIANENLARRNAECEPAQRLLNNQAWQLWLQLRRRSLVPIVGSENI